MMAVIYVPTYRCESLAIPDTLNTQQMVILVLPSPSQPYPYILKVVPGQWTGAVPRPAAPASPGNLLEIVSGLMLALLNQKF